jgi:hypothetical protein
MANRVADPSKYTTKADASGTELFQVNDGSADALLSTARIAAYARLVPVRTYATTTDTLLLADAGGAVHGNNASAITQTIPANASVAFPVGTTILVRQYGAGVITVTAAAGVTLRNGGATAKTAGQYKGSIALHKVGTNEWYLDGTVAAS